MDATMKNTQQITTKLEWAEDMLTRARLYLLWYITMCAAVGTYFPVLSKQQFGMASLNTSLWNYIMGSMSVETQGKVRADPDWDAANATRLGHALIAIIYGLFHGYSNKIQDGAAIDSRLFPAKMSDARARVLGLTANGEAAKIGKFAMSAMTATIASSTGAQSRKAPVPHDSYVCPQCSTRGEHFHDCCPQLSATERQALTKARIDSRDKGRSAGAKGTQDADAMRKMISECVKDALAANGSSTKAPSAQEVKDQDTNVANYAAIGRMVMNGSMI